MQFIATGDWHITDKKPQSRTDADYFQTIMSKLKCMFTYAANNGIHTILQSGDFFDSHRASDFLKQQMIEFLLDQKEENDIYVYAVYGQHDLRFHSSDTENTPLKVLEKARAVTILYPETPLCLVSNGERINLWGASWNEEPLPIGGDTGNDHHLDTNILVTHRMVIQDKLWEQQEDFTFSKNMFRKYKHDFFVTGDNHQTFDVNIGKRHLCNSGSLMRSNVSQTKHLPCFYVCDTSKCASTKVLLDVEPIHSIMDVETALEKKKVNEELQLFIDSISDSTTQHTELTDFVTTLKDADVPVEVMAEVDNFLTQVENAEKG